MYSHHRSRGKLHWFPHVSTQTFYSTQNISAQKPPAVKMSRHEFVLTAKRLRQNAIEKEKSLFRTLLSNEDNAWNISFSHFFHTNFGFEKSNSVEEMSRFCTPCPQSCQSCLHCYSCHQLHRWHHCHSYHHCHSCHYCHGCHPLHSFRHCYCCHLPLLPKWSAVSST